MTKKKPKTDYCPYKAQWFGKTKEAQLKSAGFKYKRGSLIKAKKACPKTIYETYPTSCDLNPSGVQMVASGDISKGDILLVWDYDSCESYVKYYVRLGDEKRTRVPAIKHVFSFLTGEKIIEVTMFVWGHYLERDIHNAWWQKARKGVFRPKKKNRPKVLGKGFAFDDAPEVSD